MNQFGYFEGDVITKWEDDGRLMTLVNTIKYVDPQGIEWIAPAGSWTDGASIPQMAWTLVGGPYEGKHRKAAVFHDVACVERKRAWEQVHRMFYSAMQAAGVPELTAKQMFAAVYAFGPRWEPVPFAAEPIEPAEVPRSGQKGAHPTFGGSKSPTAELPSGAPVPPPLSEFNPQDRAEVADLQQRIAVEDLSLEAIEALVETKS